MNLQSLTIQQKINLTIFGFLVIFFFIAFFFILPLVSQIKEDGVELAQKKQNIELLYQDWRVLENSRKEYQKIENELNALPAILPNGEALKFIMMIETIAQSTGNKQEVSVVKASNDKTSPKDTNINLQITLKGSFPNLVKFLLYLENAPYFSEIKSLQLQGMTQKDIESLKEGKGIGLSSGDITSTLKVSAYQ